MTATSQAGVILELRLAPRAGRTIRRLAISFVLMSAGCLVLVFWELTRERAPNFGPMIMLVGILPLAVVWVQALGGPLVKVYEDGRIWLRTSINIDWNTTLSPGWTAGRSVRTGRFVFQEKVLVFQDDGGREGVLSAESFDETDLEHLLELSA